jgi:hypothetical protein
MQIGFVKTTPGKALLTAMPRVGSVARHLQCRVGNTIGKPKRLGTGTNGDKDQRSKDTEKIPHK